MGETTGPVTERRSRDADGATRRLQDLWLGGMTLPRSAARTGLPVAEAAAVLAELGFEPAPPSRREQAERLRNLVGDRLSPAEIAGRLGLTEEQVRARMVRAGLPLPPKAVELQAAEAVRLYREEGLSVRAVASGSARTTAPCGATSTGPGSPADPGAAPG
jgi:hypothetical protein